jgi:penicillin-binding protein 2
MDVDAGRILASYRMDVAARRVVPPGSTVKPLSLLALLDAGLVSARTTVMCPRTVRLGGRTLDCAHDTGLGPIDGAKALAYSCNHFFITVSGPAPADLLTRAFQRAGFSSLSGKWPTEVAGTVAQTGTREAAQLLSIGEDNVGVTPLALAEAYRGLARRLQRAGNTADIRLVLRGLEMAVENGTGRLAASKDMQVAGKTGTSRGHAWFAGFAPAAVPEIVVVVFVEQGRGGDDAAPVAGKIFDSFSASKGRR